MAQLTIEDLNDLDGEMVETDGGDETESVTESENEHVPKFLAVATATNRTALSDPIRAVLKYAAENEGARIDASDRGEFTADITTGECAGSVPSVVPPHGVITWSVRPDRAPVDEGLDFFEERDSFETVIVDKIVSLGSTAEEMKERAARILNDHGCDLVLLEADLRLEAGSKAAQAHIDTLASLDRAGVSIQRETTVDDLRSRGVDVPDGGRAPLGFKWRDGDLETSDRYDKVCSDLELVKERIEAEFDDVGISKGEAARRLDTSRRTIKRCIEERPEMYGLDA